MQQPFHCLLLLFLPIIIYFLSLTSDAQPPFNYPSANISTKWKNSWPLPKNLTYRDIVAVRPILFRGTDRHGPRPTFACGFFCYTSCKSVQFSISIVFAYGGDIDNITSQQIVWSANRDRPVRENATLEFSKNGDLLLLDSDGTEVWSTNTSGKSVVGMKLNEVGSLVLFDDNNKTVWSSMDYPTDFLVLGQSLKQGQRLTANVSVTNSSQGPVHLTIVPGGFQAFIGSQLYYEYAPYALGDFTHITFNNGSLDVFAGSNTREGNIPLQLANSVQYMQLDYIGRLRIYEWSSSSTGWTFLGDVFQVGYLDDYCAYPNVCGEYGICFNGQCTCPVSVDDNLDYFRLIDQRNPNLGCVPINAISCNSNKTQQFLSLLNVSYFNYIDNAAIYMNNTNAESCQEACSKKCSCKAALFQYGQNASTGNCFLPSELYSLTYNKPDITNNNSSAFIKVQSLPNTNSASETNLAAFLKVKMLAVEL